MKKRVLSMLLAASLVIGMFAGTALAADENGTPAGEEELIAEETGSTEAYPTVPHVARVEITMGIPAIGDQVRDFYSSITAAGYDEDGNSVELDLFVSLGKFKTTSIESGEPADFDETITDEYVLWGAEVGVSPKTDENDEYCAYVDEETIITVNGGSEGIFQEEIIYYEEFNGLYIPIAFAPDAQALSYRPIYLDIPYTINVKQGGTVEPPKTNAVISLFAIEDSKIDSQDVTVSGGEVEIDGVGSYEGILRLRIEGTEDKEYYYEDVHEFLLKEFGEAAFILEDPGKNWTAEGVNAYEVRVERWITKYEPPQNAVLGDDVIEVGSVDYWGGTYILSCDGYDVDFEKDSVEQVTSGQTRMTFDLTYTENKEEPEPKPEEPKKDEPAKKDPVKKQPVQKYTSPATGDTNNSFVWIIVMAVAVAAAAGVVVVKKIRK